MASLSEISIKRPVLAIVMSITIIVFGLIGYNYLGVREYPSVDPPVVNVQTSYTGANADIIESQITEPLEESINGIAGIRTLTSSSRDGRSSITVEFDLAVNIEDAANDVRDRVSRSMAVLPKDVDPPVISKSDADSGPIYNLNLSSKTRNILNLNEIATRNVKEKLQTIPGVSSVQMWGEKKYAMRLNIDPDRLASFRLTAPDIVAALTKQNIELPSGSIEGANTELTVRTQGRLTTVEDFENLIIKEEGDRSVKFSDVGDVVLASENEKTMFKRDNVPMISIAVIPQPGSNQIEIVNSIRKKLIQIQTTMPDDVLLKEGFDNTRYVRRSIIEVEETILTAILLVTIIIFLFLRDWRSTIIPLTAIPVSLIGVFFFMYLVGFSINVLTLLGIVLSIGLVVDDAIVVLENIYSKIEEGLSPWKAAQEGSKEIYFAVISTTVTLVAVFLPVIFLQGITGRLFREFGIVVAGSVIISAFVSLTLTPMLGSRLLKGGHSKPWFYRVTEPFFVWLNRSYESSLNSFLSARWLAWVLMVSLFGIIFALFKTGAIPSELAPLEDRGMLRVNATAPEGVTFEYMLNYTDEMSNFLSKAIPDNERKNIYAYTSPPFGNGGSNTGSMRIMLTDPENRRSQQAIAEELQPKIKKFTGAKAVLIQDPTLSTGQRGGGGLPIAFVVQAPNFEKLKKMMPLFLAKVRESPKFENSDVNLKFTKPELRLEIDRSKAQNLGISIQDVAQTLQLGLSGRRFGYFVMDGKQYQIIGQINRDLRNDVKDLKSLYVKNNRGDLIQLDNLVKITEQSTPPQLYRYNRYVAATVQAQMAKGVTMGEALNEMDKLAKETFDVSFSTAYDGQSKEFKESSSSLLFAFALAILLIYLILSAQFESFIDPLIILFTVPLAVAGALLTLWDFSQTLNIFSQIGIIVLIGLVTKNGILIVEFANQKKETGLSKLEAVKVAAAARFRPIVMTSLCTILGILPIALALGSGAKSRVSMGIAVVGGMLFSTTLTLYIIPAIYSFMSSNFKKSKEEVTEEATHVIG
ncbi:MAG: efflux RND transporter permease subunit [Cytophagia bacterium]|nr:efflux RND transporter permease subunit [Cytophagia bacterium]